MRRDSLLVDLRKFFDDENSKNYFPHMMIAMEVNENGTPIGAAVKMKCSPIMALGVIDLLHDKLNEAREQVLVELSEFEKENMSVESSTESLNDFDSIMKQAMSNISEEDKNFFEDCQRRAIEAIFKQDEDALRSITNEMREYVKNKMKDDNSDDFNLDDFKGGF